MPSDPKVIVINDTSPGGHIGCLLVMQRLQGGLATTGCRVTASLALPALRGGALRHLLHECDLVVVNGEGTLHHDGRGARLIAGAVAQAVAAGRPVVLVNTVWQENKKIAGVAASFARIYVRESRSAAALAALGSSAAIVPDLLLSAVASRNLRDRPPPASSLAVFDHVRPRTAVRLARFAVRHQANFLSLAPRPPLRSLRTFLGYCRFMVQADFPEQLEEAQLPAALAAAVVVSGRFHGACLAIAAGRPLVAIGSNTHKIEGMLEDAGLGEGAIVVENSADAVQWEESVERAVAKLQEVAGDARRLAAFRQACAHYVERARRESDGMFTTLGDMAAKSAGTAC